MPSTTHSGPTYALAHLCLSFDFIDFFLWSLQSNSRFDAGKNAALSALPDTATDLDRERALTAFYQHWLQQEHTTMDAYTDEWRRRNFQEIILAARVHYHRLLSRLRPS